MKSFIMGLWRWMVKQVQESDGRPPYPFDDPEGTQQWEAGKEEAEANKLVREVKEIVGSK
ncbi:hypothetical protein [Hymenobacter sp. YC55]|uniref:hypothetical protein n=1 Tax=Hymenobacter sp. YC55 TaxID=3034019 RepID=UPI0023F7E10E|nr:hypothetical protein [Hymenobacter sp. YC55]MDF7810495.1 hypothetical protein [Hymenobacter sp. YC55]